MWRLFLYINEIKTKLNKTKFACLSEASFGIREEKSGTLLTQMSSMAWFFMQTKAARSLTIAQWSTHRLKLMDNLYNLTTRSRIAEARHPEKLPTTPSDHLPISST